MELILFWGVAQYPPGNLREGQWKGVYPHSSDSAVIQKGHKKTVPPIHRKSRGGKP